MSILRDIRAQLIQVNPGQQVMRVRDRQAWITSLAEYAQQRLVAALFGIFSVLALALAAVRLYSVASLGRGRGDDPHRGTWHPHGPRRKIGRGVSDRHVIDGWECWWWAVGVGLLLSIAFDKLATKWVTETSRATPSSWLA